MAAATQYPPQYSELQHYQPQPVVEAVAVAAATAEVKSRSGLAKLEAVLWSAVLGLQVAAAAAAVAVVAVAVAVAPPCVRCGKLCYDAAFRIPAASLARPEDLADLFCTNCTKHIRIRNPQNGTNCTHVQLNLFATVWSGPRTSNRRLLAPSSRSL